MIQTLDQNEYTFSFCGRDIKFKKLNENNGEIVIYPGQFRENVNVRYACKPYICEIHLADGRRRTIDIGTEEDWGNIQECVPGDVGCTDDNWKDSIGWGNDADGHVKIIKVTMLDYNGDEIEVPVEDFWKDVQDQIILFEA